MSRTRPPPTLSIPPIPASLLALSVRKDPKPSDPTTSNYLWPGLLFLWSEDNNAHPARRPNEASVSEPAGRLRLCIRGDFEWASERREGEVDVGERSGDFRNETERMPSPVCRVPIPSSIDYLNPAAVDEGIGGFDCPFYLTSAQRFPSIIRPVNRNHTGLADVRGATNALVIKTLKDAAIVGHSTSPPCLTSKPRHQDGGARGSRCQPKPRVGVAFHRLRSLPKGGMRPAGVWTCGAQGDTDTPSPSPSIEIG